MLQTEIVPFIRPTAGAYPGYIPHAEDLAQKKKKNPGIGFIIEVQKSSRYDAPASENPINRKLLISGANEPRLGIARTRRIFGNIDDIPGLLPLENFLRRFSRSLPIVFAELTRSAFSIANMITNGRPFRYFSRSQPQIQLLNHVARVIR